jgi:hypothetical protein
MISQLSKMLRAQGHSACAIIDQVVFFHVSHSPTMQCAVLASDDRAPVAVRAVNHANDLDQLNLRESVQRYLDRPDGFSNTAKELVCQFLSDWIKQVSASSVMPQLVVSVAEHLVEVDHWLSDDGPGSCVLAGPWVIWTSGRFGMSDLMIAKNAGNLPSPELATAGRWDSIGHFIEDDLVSLSTELSAWQTAKSVWSFRERAVPIIHRECRLT